MKTNKQNKQYRLGFTLIEMVGVLAVIAILAALLVPKIFAAIDESRYNNTVASINSVKAATMSYFGKQGSFPSATNNFDQTLITDGYLETPFTPRIGASPDLLVALAASVPTPGFNKLDGTSKAADGTVVYISLGSIPAADAWELSKRIDGVDMSAADNASADDEGRVIYAEPASGKATVNVYMAHK
jgi:prepilin-type N-terminal cleavage/methylation domain-containing protein